MSRKVDSWVWRIIESKCCLNKLKQTQLSDLNFKVACLSPDQSCFFDWSWELELGHPPELLINVELFLRNEKNHGFEIDYVDYRL